MFYILSPSYSFKCIVTNIIFKKNCVSYLYIADFVSYFANIENILHAQTDIFLLHNKKYFNETSKYNLSTTDRKPEKSNMLFFFFFFEETLNITISKIQIHYVNVNECWTIIQPTIFSEQHNIKEILKIFKFKFKKISLLLKFLKY